MKLCVAERSALKSFVRAICVGCSVALATLPAAQPGNAQEAGTDVAYNIPAGNLGTALTRWAQLSGYKLLAPGDVLEGRTTPGLSGAYQPQDALSALLSGSGLSYSIDGSTVTVSDPAADAGATIDGAIALDTINVSGAGTASGASGSGYQGTPDWVYEAPAAVSVVSREAIQNIPARNARDLLDNVAGVYANRAEAQNPGIAVNIRGLQDNDRVVMMIDGARQSFQRGGHGVTQRTYVDTAFIREIDIEKSTTAGAGSLGSLGGSVNFRSILAEDIIAPGKDAGMEVNATTGTNGYYFDGSVAAAFRGEGIAITGGISRKNIGPYDVGENRELSLGTTYEGTTMLFSGQSVLSGILKAEAELDDGMKLTLGWMRNDSEFSTGNYSDLLDGILLETKQTVVNQTYTAAFDWKPDDDLVDLKAKLYYNDVDNDDWGVIIDGKPRHYEMGTLGGSIENTSRFETEIGLLSFNYGGEAFRDDGKSTVPSYIVDGIDMAPFWNGGTPGGTRDVAGGFATAKLEHDDWLMIQGGARYDWYHSTGSTTIYGNETVIYHPGVCLRYYPNGECSIWRTRPSYETVPPQSYDVRIDQSDSAFLPTFTVAVKPFEWLQPFVKYSKSFRPPTIMESFLASGHTGDGINTWAPNPNLTPERGETWEIGANITKDGLFKTEDSLRLKVVGFDRDVEDYIALGRSYVEETDKIYSSPINLLGTTRMKGIEIEANYDARAWYLGGTLTYNKTDWAETYDLNGITEQLGPNTAVLFVQPEMRFAVDAGVRLFDEKLVLGGRMTQVSETEPTIGTLQNNYKLDGYRIWDLYGSYAFDETTKLRFNVNNLTDEAYISALGADYYAMPGRTATTSLNVRF